MKIYKYVAERLIPVGHENAISSKALCSILCLKQRELRALIQKMRIDGIVICASDGGYFRPKDRDETLAFYRRMRGRGLSCLAAAKSARIALMDLDGQLEMELSKDDELDETLMAYFDQEHQSITNLFEVGDDGQFYIMQDR